MDATKLDMLRNGALVSKKIRALNFEYFADDVLELIEENAKLREELEAAKLRLSSRTCFVPPEFQAELNEWKQRAEAAEARIREAEQ